MEVTATEAKNRLGQMLEHCQREPVVIAKAGRRHSVLLSAATYDSLVATKAKATDEESSPPRNGQEFYERNKDWVDANNARFARIGVWNEDLRRW